jgi:hypothetical protein
MGMECDGKEADAWVTQVSDSSRVEHPMYHIEPLASSVHDS